MTSNPILLHSASTTAGTAQAYTHFSLPFARGELKKAVEVSIRADDGQNISTQTWPLAWWPDGSVRVIHGIAPLAGGSYKVETEAQNVQPPSGLCVETGCDGEVRVTNGNSGGFAFPRHALISGRFELSVGVNWSDGEVGTTELQGEAAILRQGPLFVQLERWVKVTAGAQSLRFRFQFEFFHGVPGVAVNVLLVNDCPGIVFQEIRSIHVRIARPNTRPVVYQQNYGFEYLESRFVETGEAVDVRVDGSNFRPYIHNHEVLGDGNVYPHYLRPPANLTTSAVFLKGEGEILQVEMEDFHLLRPKGILLEPGGVELALWPEWAEPLRLQQGRRRQVRLALNWGHREVPQDQAAVSAASAALLDVHRAQLPAEIYARAEFFDQPRVLTYRPDKYPRFEGWLRAASNLNTVARFFDLGDTPDGHYQSTYTPVGYARRIAPGPEPRFYTASGRNAQCFEHLEAREPIWVNNEYDVLFALGTEYLRSRNLALYRQLRWFSRHTVEVDFLCYSDHPIHHRGQPAHSENHTSASAYPSHFWTQGLTQYYFLSGDEDALEVVRALADKTIWYFDHPRLGGLHSGVNREMGWSVLTLVSAYEATGEKKYDEYARRLIDAVIAEPLPEDLPDLNFGHTSLLLGCRAYLEAHAHSEDTRPVWEWYLRVLELGICGSRSAPEKAAELALKLSYDYELAARGDAARLLPRPGMLIGFAAPDCLAYAYERTGNTAYLEAGIRALQAFLDGNPGYPSPSFRQPLPEGKSFAWGYRSWIAYFGALDRAGWLSHFDYHAPDFTR